MRSHLTLPGFNGRYRIYTTGKVWDKHLKVFLIARPNSTGYLRVRLYDGKRYFIHRLVALTYNQRKEIESLYRTGKYTMRKLSIRYNVSRVTIGNCVKLFKQR